MNDRMIFLQTFLIIIFVNIEFSYSYGADVSFPIHYDSLKQGPLGNRIEFYEHYMNGCRKFYKEKSERCDSYEKDRLEMSLRQPQSMVVSFRFETSNKSATHLL
jgi:hypothetical protein